MEDFNIAAWLGHSASIGAIVGAVVGWFPPVAAFIAIGYYILQIYESTTVQIWLQSRRLRKIAQLKIEMAKLEAVELVQHPVNRHDILPARLAAQALIDKAKEDAAFILEEAARKKAELKDG